ncbi:hypothetical protein GTP44_01220 [Duganella sp. FT50W]|uniref:Uncharacterized protein n=1 Tax=Duganella lactea TaxID=2692173 RepID=A0A6L8MD28_9BURK|nr:hypothetical protein [Duganella lactea]MYM80580.1 hypothetical protein [Duganella lactea]
MVTKGLPGVSSARFVVMYERDEADRYLPGEILFNYPISMFFQKATVSFKQRLAAWVKK